MDFCTVCMLSNDGDSLERGLRGWVYAKLVPVQSFPFFALIVQVPTRERIYTTDASQFLNCKSMSAQE